MNRFHFHRLSTLSLLLIFVSFVARAQSDPPVVVVLGDSIGEAVQSGDASVETQPFGYPNWVAYKLGVPFALPLIQSGPFESVGDTDGRSRIYPNFAGDNLAVSGADVDSLLHDAADATTTGEIDSETDLVLFPRLGSQMDIVEAWAPAPDIVLCWIGNNDVLSAALSYDQLDGSQLTDVATFDGRFNEIAQRLGALGSNVVFANIPSVTSIGYLLDGQDLIKFLGSDFGLAEGSRTSVVTMFLIKLGLDDGSLLSDPDYVLDAGEIAAIQDRIEVFNDIIATAAADIDAPVVNANAIFDFLVSNPPEILGIPLSHRFLGGMFSLDGVHPSNTIHAVIANEFIKALNDHYLMSIPEITGDEFFFTFWFDPHIDKDGDGRVTGRLFAGLLETLGPFLGFSGDLDDIVADQATTRFDGGGAELLQRYNRLQDRRRRAGAETEALSPSMDVIQLLESAFGVKNRM